MKPAESLITRVVASLKSEAALPIPILHSWDTDPEGYPCVIVSAEKEKGEHRKLPVLNLTIDLKTNRDQTLEPARAAYSEALFDHIEAHAETIALAMIDDGWQTRAWNDGDEASAPDEDRLWSSGYDYRLTLMEI